MVQPKAGADLGLGGRLGRALRLLEPLKKGRSPAPGCGTGPAPPILDSPQETGYTSSP